MTLPPAEEGFDIPAQFVGLRLESLEDLNELIKPS